MAASSIVKLSKQNYSMWSAQVLTTIRRVVRLGSASPWVSILLSVKRGDGSSRRFELKTAAQAWKAINDMFASQTRARAINIRLALTTTQKGSLTISEYFSKMKALGNDGKPLEDEDMVAYILNGLDVEFNHVVSALVTS